ncbi:hypothetical protein ACWC9R_06920 [Streptomyces sp. NPDC001219]
MARSIASDWSTCPPSHTGWAFGLGRRLLDEFKLVAATKSGTRNAAVDTAHFHAEYATAEAKLRSGRAWAMEVWRDIEDTLNGGELLSTGQDTLLRPELNHATWTVQDVGQKMAQRRAASSTLGISRPDAMTTTRAASAHRHEREPVFAPLPEFMKPAAIA